MSSTHWSTKGKTWDVVTLNTNIQCRLLKLTFTEGSLLPDSSYTSLSFSSQILFADLKTMICQTCIHQSFEVMPLFVEEIQWLTHTTWERRTVSSYIFQCFWLLYCSFLYVTFKLHHVTNNFRLEAFLLDCLKAHTGNIMWVTTLSTLKLTRLLTSLVHLLGNGFLSMI